ncbi:MAG: B12-binding domain-containing radical SAM protein [Spirochaetae bacterium HGW-Spirochaetae-5]|nr:MAG: B12-binding domain-containing radical SAM protein [Spirochaetae bacterium HGW-Spirochaetae-5]
MKKILLINPPYPFEEHPSAPFGLMSLAAYLIEKGYEVRIEDYIIEQNSIERYKSVIEEFNPDIIGATAVSMTVKKSLAILREYRSLAPGVITVMGGAHATFDSEGVLSSGIVDYIVRGEGEITFTELLNALSEKRDTAAVNGISYITDNIIHHTPDRELIEDINILPYPARDIIALSKYKAMDLPVNMITARGCPHSCIFCLGRKMVGSRLRYFNIERVIDEFELLSKMGFSQINIADDLFTSNKKRCIAICDGIISRGIKQPWSAFARVDTISEDLLLKLKESGCTTLCFGIESGNQEILDRVKKKTDLEKCRAAAEMCRNTGITPMASYILGLPGETEETVMNTLRFAGELNMDFGIHILSPFPGTEIREKAEEYGITILTDDWDLYDANQSVCSTGGITPERVDAIVHGFYRSLEKYMDETALKKNRGEAISLRDDSMLRHVELYKFNMELIEKRLIENYTDPGSLDTGEFKKNLSIYLKEKTGRNNDFISDEIQRMITKGCLGIIWKDSLPQISWI